MEQTGRPRYLTVEMVAATFAVSKSSIYRAVEAGELRAVRLGRTVRIPAEAVDEYLAACERAAAGGGGAA